MLIRSQDKEDIYILENIDRIGACKVYGKNETGWVVELNHSNPIGEYSTEEKAIKVLDMICENYQRLDYVKYGIDFVGECKAVFQIPLESEVL